MVLVVLRISNTWVLDFYVVSVILSEFMTIFTAFNFWTGPRFIFELYS